MNKEEYQLLIDNLPPCPGILWREMASRSAVLVPFVFLDGEYHLLFEKRSPHIRQGGEICFPGGGIKDDEEHDSAETAVRETMEELGLHREAIRVHGRTDSVIAAMGAVIDVHIGELLIDSVRDCRINTSEVDEIFVLPFRYFAEHPPRVYELHMEVKPSYFDENGREVVLFPAEELGLPERYARPWKGHNYSVLVYPYEKHTIWGITARIIAALTASFSSQEKD